MSRIAYDPTKDTFARWIRHSRWLRTAFFRILDLFFLRSWYVREAIRSMARDGTLRSGKVKEGPDQDALSLDILDAGSGFGQYDRFLLRTFPQAGILAVDVKEEYLEDCRHHFHREITAGRITFRRHDLTADELPPSSFDLVVCVDVLEHIEEDVAVMQRLQAALRPGGVMVMHSPSHLSEDDAGEDEFFVDEHARAGYSREELTGKMSRAGLHPLRISYTYGAAGHRAWEWLIKRPMLWFNRFGMLPLIWLPFYYLLVLPPGLFLMKRDMQRENEYGTGILGVAIKQ